MSHPALTLPQQDCTRCGEPFRLGQAVEREPFPYPTIPGRTWSHAGGADGCIKATSDRGPRTQRRVAVVLAIAALREQDDPDAQRVGSFLDIALEGEFDPEPEIVPEIVERLPFDPEPRPIAGPIHETCGHPWSEHGTAGCIAKIDDNYCFCMWRAPGDAGSTPKPTLEEIAEPAGEEAR